MIYTYSEVTPDEETWRKFVALADEVFAGNASVIYDDYLEDMPVSIDLPTKNLDGSESYNTVYLSPETLDDWRSTRYSASSMSREIDAMWYE